MIFQEVLTIEQIKREAQAAAATQDDVDAACRFPFNTEAGRIFREEFVWIRSIINAKALAQASGAAGV